MSNTKSLGEIKSCLPRFCLVFLQEVHKVMLVVGIFPSLVRLAVDCSGNSRKAADLIAPHRFERVKFHRDSLELGEGQSGQRGPSSTLVELLNCYIRLSNSISAQPCVRL